MIKNNNRYLSNKVMRILEASLVMVLLGGCGSEFEDGVGGNVYVSQLDLDDGCGLCVPECNEKVCGDDGCGGDCGSCDEGWLCGSAGQCDSCAEGYIDYPTCIVDPSLADSCNGLGTCDDGVCSCSSDDDHGDACEFSCTDGTKNGEEWGVDCGGPCEMSCGPQPLVDNENGTVTDPNTNLIWQQTPSTDYFKVCQNMMDYSECPDEDMHAKNHCENNDDDLPGTGWRLPTISELRSIVKDCDNAFWDPVTNTGGACGVTDECNNYWMCATRCDDCTYKSGPGENGHYLDPLFDLSGHSWFWASSPSVMYIDRGWSIAFYSGFINNNYIFNDFGVRCVREESEL